MTRLSVTSVVLLLVVICLSESSVADDRAYCYQKVTEPGAAGGGQLQINGFAIEVKAIKDPNVRGHMLCSGRVVSPEGKTVYETSDWGMEIDKASGRDISGNGEADAVLVSFSGGAHCCWMYHIVSLGKKPGLIAEFENQDTASFEDLRGDGQTEIVIRDGDYDSGFGLVHAFAVFPLLIVRMRGGAFQDASAGFRPVFEKEIKQKEAQLDSALLKEFLKSDPYDAEGHDDLEYQRTKSAILLIVLDYLYSGQPEQARKMLGKLWPANSQERTWTEMVKGYCSGLRTQLELEATPPCASP